MVVRVWVVYTQGWWSIAHPISLAGDNHYIINPPYTTSWEKDQHYYYYLIHITYTPSKSQKKIISQTILSQSGSKWLDHWMHAELLRS